MKSTFRLYVYDIESRKEIHAYAWNGTSEAGIKDGVRYTDTALSYDVFDFETKKNITITASTFAGRRVACKWWVAGEKPEWRVLVGSKDGFQGNEAGPHKSKATLGTKARDLGPYPG